MLAVGEGKKLRFGDLFSMNDFMEMHWGYGIWEKAAGEVIDITGKEFLDDMDKIISGSGFRVLPLASCFSTDGDVLSQWRAYAKDGTGYAVGFRADMLLKLPVRALRVSYDRAQQINETKAAILGLFEAEKGEEKKRGDNFFDACVQLWFDIAAFKNPGFAEEQEVRLIHAVNFESVNDGLRIVDGAGMAFEEEYLPKPVRFQMRGASPVPYLDIDFSNNGKVNPIAEVVLGPKNDSLPTGVLVFLETMGISNVRLRRSQASYR
ncbi:hypothetical protein WI29_21255 [Burkholderia ubonensis]|nr:hypothetical protein WI31_09505 [Burkholderia ubonensis]KUZ15639.1 hypothetical protein WI29_21255 [Burkholderia ubonensis]KUZ25402.1 hypothetical protein WI30_28930 [Burkholderia ubonensis]KUZ32220.1 hypothetical protein WI32_23005 [Burkholderia ubonensis]KUZ52325.1 hypothetical protein WI34_30040 [Burkholderia ubonensis]